MCAVHKPLDLTSKLINNSDDSDELPKPKQATEFTQKDTDRNGYQDSIMTDMSAEHAV